MREIMNIITEGLGNKFGQPLKNNLNVIALADMLSELTNRDKFVLAMRKVLRNDEEQLNRWELEQLAYAFISIVRETPEQKLKIARKMMLAYLKDGEGEEAPEDKYHIR